MAVVRARSSSTSGQHSFVYYIHSRLPVSYKGVLITRRLHRVHFLPNEDSQAFGFLDPDDVIRGAHLIPAFAHGLVEDEWKAYYVNFFVDRDMFMRYQGLGVGHSYRATSDTPNERQLDAEGVVSEDSEPAGSFEVPADAEGSDDSESEAGSDQDGVDDLGPEDGEGDVGDVEAEGYDDL
ncbi:hypothetical protein FA95DRAFT_1684912 [Auriscalpium vulgare]|uniref:Uncharacterized protein n=1 Tax=Auriscalpium vulgare TaxID=40419 RepID=A0ACB8QZT1_9AGAM|nr:hypothetical protein FA95DRAFT_1684912 [Auriscalpium vulgare]